MCGTKPLRLREVQANGSSVHRAVTGVILFNLASKNPVPLTEIINMNYYNYETQDLYLVSGPFYLYEVVL